MTLLAEMTWGQWLLGFLIVCVCMFLMLVILLQRGRGVGLAGAFGGGGGGAFGAKTGDVFTWITVAFAGVFLFLTVLGNFVFEPTGMVIATPPTAQPVPGPPGEPQTLQLPLEEGVDPAGVKVEMIGEDGQVIPLDVKITEEPAGSPAPAAPAGESSAAGTGAADAATKAAEPPADPPKDNDPQDPGR